MPSPVVFRQVIPLFGVSDIRGSSTTRNRSIQADLEHQLNLALEVIQTAGKSHCQSQIPMASTFAQNSAHRVDEIEAV